jgi:hypothetical protein
MESKKEWGKSAQGMSAPKQYTYVYIEYCAMDGKF